MASFDALLVDLLQSALTAVTARLPALFARIMAAMPRIFLFFGVWFMATLYLTPAWHDIGVWITKHFPTRSAAILRGVRSSLFSTLLLYGRAYAILIALTFTELFIGLSLLGVPYVFGLSFLIALIDILPVLGVGTVLLPWALLALLWGNTRMGFGLLVLYAVISIVRQILEPRVIGTQVGLHPLIALFSLYVGARLFGAAGLFLLPMAAAVLARYLSGRKKEQDENAKESTARKRQGRVQKRQTAP
jgi:sporulation integral membrane protein YtvI